MRSTYSLLAIPCSTAGQQSSSFAVPWQVNKFLLYSSMTSKQIPPLQFLGCSTHSLHCSSIFHSPRWGLQSPVDHMTTRQGTSWHGNYLIKHLVISSTLPEPHTTDGCYHEPLSRHQSLQTNRNKSYYRNLLVEFTEYRTMIRCKQTGKKVHIIFLKIFSWLFVNTMSKATC